MSRLTPIRTSRTEPKATRRTRPVVLMPGEVPKSLQAALASPVALRAYILADAALVRGQLTRCQRKQVSLAVAKINRATSRISARLPPSAGQDLSGHSVQDAGNARTADPTVEVLLSITQAMILRRGEISDKDFQTLRTAGFSDAHIAEVVASIALKIFSRHFKSAAFAEAVFPVLGSGSESCALAFRSDAVRPRSSASQLSQVHGRNQKPDDSLSNILISL